MVTFLVFHSMDHVFTMCLLWLLCGKEINNCVCFAELALFQQMFSNQEEL